MFKRFKSRIRINPKNQNKKYRKDALEKFHDKLPTLKFLDPACGSGNFLMVAYRELRRLEHEVIDEINEGNALLFDTSDLIKVEIEQFYGIEIVPYAVSVAKIGLWMMDHLMNIEASDLFGRLYLRLPLHPSANITVGDALKLNWADIISPQDLDYILGNPPFIGARLMSKEQKEEFMKIMKFKNSGNLDFVAAWYYKSVLMMLENNNIKASLVSTNSVFQGEQANTLWMNLFSLGCHINFAHQTFKWDNNGAVVHVAIAGFSLQNEASKYLTIYNSNKHTNETIKVKNINEYLVNAPIANIQKSKKQISNMPSMTFGSMANAGDHLFFNEYEYESFIKDFPEFKQYIYKFIGSKEYIRNETRYILYLKYAPISLLKNNKIIMERIQNVKKLRLASNRPKTIELASTPTLLGEDRVSFSKKLLIPKTSSSRRDYIPIGFVNEDTIISDGAFQLVDADLYIFGVLQSKMHTLWIKTVAGRLKSDVRYSNTLVYNTFVFPVVNETQKKIVEKAATELLEVRETYIDKGFSIADLYNELLMPQDLQKAHRNLDNALEKLYSNHKFISDDERIAYLIKMYHNSKN
ncbi:class I SAM-dependent DNA methyltransferase [Macrococcoides canis]